MGHKKVERIDPLTRKLPPFGMDSHAHVNDARFDADREDVLARAQAVGIVTILNIFGDPLAFAEEKHVFDNHPEVFFALGVHPCDGLTWNNEVESALCDALANEPRIRAVGEIGLDYYWKDCPHETQMAVFSRQIAIAKEMHLPIVIHCRDAVTECLHLLTVNACQGYPVLWHCFGGDATLARRIVENGWMISLPGPVTYPANTVVREALPSIPKDRLLVETDCPYLAPHPHRGTRNEPAYTVFTIEAMANALGCDKESLWRTCGDNGRAFFGIGL